MFNLWSHNLAVVVDGSKGTDEAVLDPGAGTDDRRPADLRPDDRSSGLDDDPPVDLGLCINRPVDAGRNGLEDQPVGLEEGCELAGVDPPSLQLLAADVVAVIDQPLDGVSDLQLAPARRFDRSHRVVNGPVKQVDPDQRQIRWRIGGFLHQLDHPPGAVKVRDSETVWIGNSSKENLGYWRTFDLVFVTIRQCRRGCPSPLGLELVDEALYTLLDEVVPQVHDEVGVAEEVPGDEYTVRQTQRCVLGYVGDLETPSRPVADRNHHLVGGVAHDDPDVLYPRLCHRLQAIEEDRLVGHRHQLLGAGVGDRAKAGAGTAGQDERFHCTTL